MNVLYTILKNNNKTTLLFMHQSTLQIDLNVNIKDAVIWDLTPHNSVTTLHQKTKNYNLYSHCHENLECHNTNIEHLQTVEVDQRLTGPQTHLRLIISTTHLLL